MEPVLSNPYLVRKGDTLNGIAKRSGNSLADLIRWNGIKNPNLLNEGQTLYLSEEKAFGVRVLFLDALRMPIENLRYKLLFDGRTVSSSTKSDGRSSSVVTRSAMSQIEVLVQDMQGKWVSLGKIASDYGYKLITLVSGAIVFKGETELHPKNAPAKPNGMTAAKPGAPNPQAPLPSKASGTSTKNNPAVKTAKAKGKHGQSIIEVSVDIPQGLLDFFAHYTGGEISESDWEDTAKSLVCEPEVLKAISKVESGGRSSFFHLNKQDGALIPAILFERQYFSRLTKGKYDGTHSDLSWPNAYVRVSKAHPLGSKNAKMPDGRIEASDVYAANISAPYLRLINAYRLDPDAALKACSWGKFQVLGANFNLCGMKNSKEFVTKMCTSEFSQIQLLANFIQNKPRSWKDPHHKELGKEISLLEAVRSRNWRAIAFNYNGPGYDTSTFRYHVELEKAYNHYKSDGA